MGIFDNFKKTERKFSGSFKKTEYFSLTPGAHIIRVLNTSETSIPTHYIPSIRTSVKCLGDDDCPICRRNKGLFIENPSTARSHANFVSRSYRVFMNVLDRTMVKVCSNCGKEVMRAGKEYPSTCTGCGNFITDVSPAPSNKVKLLSASETFAQQLAGLEQATLDTNQDAIGLQNYDVVISVIPQTGNKKITNMSADLNRMDKVEVDSEELYGPDRWVITLDAEEIKSVLNGVSLKDVFTARKASAPASEASALESDVNDLVSSLFNDSL